MIDKLDYQASSSQCALAHACTLVEFLQICLVCWVIVQDLTLLLLLTFKADGSTPEGRVWAFEQTVVGLGCGDYVRTLQDVVYAGSATGLSWQRNRLAQRSLLPRWS